MHIRPYSPDDLPVLKQMTVEAFDGVSIDQGMEQVHGLINGRNWQWRKARHLDDDVAREAEGIFIAELEDRVIGYITTWRDLAAGIGHIPNLVVVADQRGRGLGRQLIQYALEHFRKSGLTHAKIETLVQNERGKHLYQSLGFQEVARQIHFVTDLGENLRKDCEDVV